MTRIGMACVLLGGWTAVNPVALAAGPTTRPAADPPRVPDNTWVEFTLTFPDAPADGRFVAARWNKMVYDSKARQALIMDRWVDGVRGSTIYANAVVGVTPITGRAELLTVTNYKRQSANGGYRTVALPANETTPTPLDRHPFGCLAYCDYDNSLYLGPGANQTAGHPGDFWRFDLAKRTWHALPTEGSPFEGKGKMLGSVMCYDSANRVIVFYCGPERSTWVLDVVSAKWRKASPKVEPPAGNGAAMTYDSRRQFVYLFAGPGSKSRQHNAPGDELWAYSARTNEWKRLADAPVPAARPGFAYSHRHDVALVAVRTGEGKPDRIILYHPDRDSWTELPQPAGAVWPADGVWQTLCYDESRDLFVYKPGTYQRARWYAFRYAPPAEPPNPGG